MAPEKFTFNPYLSDSLSYNKENAKHLLCKDGLLFILVINNCDSYVAKMLISLSLFFWFVGLLYIFLLVLEDVWLLAIVYHN
jgi:hypothetical protein